MRPRRLLLFRAFAAALVLGALVHVVTLLPRIGVLAETLTAGTWLFFTTYALSTMTALGACALAALLLWKASHKADERALTLFLGFLALFWGSLFRFLTIGAAVLIPIQRRVSRAVGQRLGKAEANRPSSPDTAPVASRISC